MSWCDLDLTLDFAVVTLTYKILSGLYLGYCNVWEVDTWKGHWLQLSLMTKIYGLLQLIIVYTFTQFVLFLLTSIFLLINFTASLLLNCLVLILHLYIHFLSHRHYFLCLNIIWTFI